MYHLKARVKMVYINIPGWTSQIRAKWMFPSATTTTGARQMARSCDVLNNCSWINQNSPFRTLMLKAPRLNNQNNSSRTNFLAWTSVTDQAQNAAALHHPKHQIVSWTHVSRRSHQNLAYVFPLNSELFWCTFLISLDKWILMF